MYQRDISPKRSMALFRGNTLPHPMKSVSSTVLVDVQSKLSGGSLWAKTMMWLCKVHMILPPLWHSWCQPQQCCMRRKLTSTILQGVWNPEMTCRPLPNLLVRQMHAAEYSLWAGWHCTGNFSNRSCWLQRPVEGDLRGKQRFFKRASSGRATNKLRTFRP